MGGPLVGFVYTAITASQLVPITPHRILDTRTVAGRAWKGRYRGQRQKWFAVRFTGADSEINVASPGGGHKPEFVTWRWEPMKNLPELIVPFKRPVFERVVKEFSRLSGVPG